MSTIRALHQLSASLVARRTLCTAATAAPSRIAGMRVAPVLKNVAFRSFASSARIFAQGSTDVTLSQKLKEESDYEKETGGASKDTPQFLKDFQAQDVWTLSDVAGQDEVTLSRKYGNENIRLIFSVADFQTAEEQFEADPGDEDALPFGDLHPIRASLTITKDNGPGAMSIDTIVQDETFVIEHISFYDDAKLGTELTPDADWKRRGLYMGPSFDTLDVNLQDEFDSFLKERGVDQPMARFVIQFAANKEQKEYVKWLKKAQGFIDL